MLTSHTKLGLIALALMGLGHAAGADQHRDGASGMLMRLDTNKDGVVDRQEVIVAQQTRFGKLDASGDGSVTMEELAAQIEAHLKKRANSDKAIERRNRRFAAMDGNGDGVVSEQEFMDFALASFDRRDENADGKLTVHELPKPRGQGRRPQDQAP